MVRFLLISLCLVVFWGELPFSQSEYAIDQIQGNKLVLEPLDASYPDLVVPQKNLLHWQEGDIVKVTLGGNGVFHLEKCPTLTEERRLATKKLLDRIFENTPLNH